MEVISLLSTNLKPNFRASPPRQCGILVSWENKPFIREWVNLLNSVTLPFCEIWQSSFLRRTKDHFELARFIFPQISIVYESENKTVCRQHCRQKSSRQVSCAKKNELFQDDREYKKQKLTRFFYAENTLLGTGSKEASMIRLNWLWQNGQLSCHGKKSIFR